jgi:hypothetical protein
MDFHPEIYKAARSGAEGGEHVFYLSAPSAAAAKKAPGVDEVRAVKVKDLSDGAGKDAAYYAASVWFGAYGVHENILNRYYFAPDEKTIRDHLERKVAERWNAVPENVSVHKIKVLPAKEWGKRYQKLSELEKRERGLQKELEEVRKKLRAARGELLSPPEQKQAKHTQ